jgi:hypothetical protein
MTSKKDPLLTLAFLFVIGLLRPRKFMKPILGKYALIMVLVALAGCNKSDPVLAVVRAQIDAGQREDFAAFIATFDPEGPAFEQTKEMFPKLFQTYDLRYTLKDLALESMSGGEARVRFDLVTEKVSGPAFRDNRVAGVLTLRKRIGEWKIFNTQITTLEYLDK